LFIMDRLIFSIAWLLAGSILALTIMSSSGGVGISQNTDRTGSPLALGNCNSCHSGGSQTPDMQVALLRDNQVVNQYTPGAQHTLRITLTSTEYVRYGFQTVALAPGNVNAGTFSTGSSGTQTVTIGGRFYGEHNRPSTTGIFELNWQAPADSIGEIAFYTAGLGAKNPTSVSGDRGTTGVLRVNAGFPLKTDLQHEDNFRVGPVPVESTLFFYTGSLRNARIMNEEGRFMLNSGNEKTDRLFVDNLAPGFYWLTGTDDTGKQRIVRFIKG